VRGAHKAGLCLACHHHTSVQALGLQSLARHHAHLLAVPQCGVAFKEVHGGGARLVARRVPLQHTQLGVPAWSSKCGMPGWRHSSTCSKGVLTCTCAHNARMQLDTYLGAHTWMHMYTCAHTYTLHTHMNDCRDKHTCTYTFTHKHIHTRMRTRTNTHK